MKNKITIILGFFLFCGSLAFALTRPDYSQISNKPMFYVRDYGAKTDGTDATAKINDCILAAVKAQALASYSIPYGENNATTVIFEPSKDYNIAGTIKLPSGIILDLNGSRLIGGIPTAGSESYAATDVAVIESAYYTGTALVSNATTTINLWRLVKSKVVNGVIAFTRCGIRLYNANEGCAVEEVSFDGVSRAVECSNCFYLKFKQLNVRNSALVTNAPAVNLGGAESHFVTVEKSSFVGCGVGVALSATTILSPTISECSFENAYVSNSVGVVDGTGIYVSAYVAGINVSGCYFEGVYAGINIGNSVYYGGINNNQFNSCNYSLYQVTDSAIRGVVWTGNSTPDDGGVIRNLIKADGMGNDIIVQQVAKAASTASGTVNFLENFIPGDFSTFVGPSLWLNNARTQAIARSTAAMGTKNYLSDAPFEGREIITTANQLPFCTVSTTATQTFITTSLVWDESQMVAFNLHLADYAGAYDLRGDIFGDDIYWIASDTASATTTIASAGTLLKFTISNIIASPSVSVSGMIRHR